ncbi:MAG: hypothetical protein V4671_04265 [Armatimonadota bacterium]
MPDTIVTNDSSLDLAGAFGEGPLRTFAGREWRISFLDVNDLIVIQKRIGSISNLDTEDMEHMRLFFYLVLRKSDPSLSEEDLDNERYTLTESAVGRMLSLKVLSSPETIGLINEMLIGAGLAQDPTEVETASPNARATARAKK